MYLRGMKKNRFATWRRKRIPYMDPPIERSAEFNQLTINKPISKVNQKEVNTYGSTWIGSLSNEGSIVGNEIRIPRKLAYMGL